MKLKFSLAFILGLVFFSTYSCSSGNKADKELKTIAESYNSHCPIKVSDDTQLDSVYSLPNKKFVYKYTLTLMDVSQFNKKEFEAERKKFVSAGIKSAEDMAYLRSLQVTFIYEYVDQKGKPLAQLTIRPEDYQ